MEKNINKFDSELDVFHIKQNCSWEGDTVVIPIKGQELRYTMSPDGPHPDLSVKPESEDVGEVAMFVAQDLHREWRSRQAEAV